MEDKELRKIELAAAEKFADKIKDYLFKCIDECDNMTAEDPIWVNRLRWSKESTVIFINECLSEMSDEIYFMEEKKDA